MSSAFNDDLAMAVLATLVLGLALTPIFGLWIWFSIALSVWWLWLLLGDDGLLDGVLR